MSVLGFFKNVVTDLIIHPVEDWVSPGSRTARRLKKDIRHGLEEPFNSVNDKFIVFSDHHRGARFEEVDRFRPNEERYKTALKYYNEKKYNLVLLGDIEEGWGSGNRMDRIFEDYRDVMSLEKEFLKEGRYYRVYGNHDDLWRKPGKVDDFFNQDAELPKVKVYPVIVFKDGEKKILMVHGCQGHNFRDRGDDLARFIIYTKFDALRLKSKRKALKIRKKKRKQEKRILKWANKKDYLVIMGHTHTIYFESLPRADLEEYAIKRYKKDLERIDSEEERKQLEKYIHILKAFRDENEKDRNKIKKDSSKILPGVFNSGNCCVSENEISGIEISGGKIRLVYWIEDRNTPVIPIDQDSSKPLEVSLDDVFEKIKRNYDS